MPSTSCPPLPGVTPSDDFVPYARLRRPWVLALSPREALDDDLGVGVDEDGHQAFAIATAARAASSMVGWLVNFDSGMPRWPEMARPSSAWCRRDGMTIGARSRLGPALDDAFGTFVARVMPPKMLMKSPSRSRRS